MFLQSWQTGSATKAMMFSRSGTSLEDHPTQRYLNERRTRHEWS